MTVIKHTLGGYVGPLGVREGVLSLPYPLLHPWRNGSSSSTVERWEPTQPVGSEHVCVHGQRGVRFQFVKKYNTVWVPTQPVGHSVRLSVCLCVHSRWGCVFRL